MRHIKSLASDLIVRSSYSPRKRVQIDFDEPSLTKQCFSQECDINAIMARSAESGFISHGNSDMPRYGDFTDVVGYQESLNIVMKAQQSFSSLPAQVRSRFSNDPANLLEFVQNPDNYDEAVALGLVEKRTVDVQENHLPEGLASA